MNFRAFAAIAVVMLSGCGGGSAAGPQTPLTAPPTSGGSGTSYLNTAQLTFAFPVGQAASAAKAAVIPQYVSPNSAKVVVTVNSVNGAAPPSWVTPNPLTIPLTTTGGSPNCTVAGGIETCALTVPAPPGSVSFTFGAEDSANHLLATITQTFAVVQGTSNTLSATLQGVPATVQFSALALAASTTGSATSSVLTVKAFDASGAQIVNGTTAANYSAPITLTDNDASGQTSLSVNGGAAAASVTVAAPTDVVKANYTGRGINPFTVTASGTGISGSANISTAVNGITFTGTTIDTSGDGSIDNGHPTLFFLAPNAAAQPVTAAELGWTDSPYAQSFSSVTLDPVSCLTGASAVATVSAGPGTTFTVTPKNAGVCKATVNDGLTDAHVNTFYISVTATTINVNGQRRH